MSHITEARGTVRRGVYRLASGRLLVRPIHVRWCRPGRPRHRRRSTGWPTIGRVPSAPRPRGVGRDGGRRRPAGAPVRCPAFRGRGRLRGHRGPGRAAHSCPGYGGSTRLGRVRLHAFQDAGQGGNDKRGEDRPRCSDWKADASTGGWGFSADMACLLRRGTPLRRASRHRAVASSRVP